MFKLLPLLPQIILMKNLSYILNAVLFIAVAHLYYLNFTKTDHPAVSNPVAAPITSDVKIKYLNTDSLQKHYQFYQDALDDLAAKRKNYESSFQSKMQKLQQDVIKFQQEARYLTQEQGEKKQQDLAQREQELLSLQESLSTKYEQEEIKTNKALIEAIQTYLTKYNENANLSFILGYTQGGPIFWANDSLDITKEVLEALNAEYQKTKEK